MENRLNIESTQNPRVKHAVKLRKAKVRKESGQTLVEGFREITRAMESGWNFIELYYCPELYLDMAADALVADLNKTGTPVFQCSENVFRKMSYRDSPDGFLALSPLVGKPLEELTLPESPLILIAEDLEKPGNLGSILRTADATGVDAVIACDHKTDLSNPNVIRASIGSIFFMPIAEATTEETLLWLQKNRIRSVAAVPDAEKEYTDADMLGGTAIIVGAEDEGLTQTWKEKADLNVRIPMLGKNDSLNVSTSAAVILYEVLRQRRSTK